MKLFQYWDTGEPPAEVAEWIEGFRVRNPDLEHRLYDRDGASWFIKKHIGVREQRAFDACIVPSMQSDFFRLCAIKRFGGVYADADFRCLRPLADLLDPIPHGLMTSWDGQLVHSFMLIRPPDDPFIDACLQLCTLNIESRDIPNAYTATGPGVPSAIQAILDSAMEAHLIKALDNPLQREWLFPQVVERARRVIQITDALRRSFEAITLVKKDVIQPWIGKTNPEYKQTDRHWLHWKGPTYAEQT
jgi:hypothetical protein